MQRAASSEQSQKKKYLTPSISVSMGVALAAVAGGGLQMEAITSSLSSELTRSMWSFCAASAASNLILATVASVSSCTTAGEAGQVTRLSS